jgi:predicted Rossmann fold flavoprotein
VTDAAAWDVVVVGAGAAGLATAIFAARAAPALRIVCLDGAAHIGAKILVSGGSRCNVTNRTVTERDFWGGSPRFVRHVLRAFPASRAAGFFEELGVALHDEEDGKLFPDTNRARTVLDALLREAARLRIAVRSSARVASVTVAGKTFTVGLADGRTMRSAAVVLATGGRSLPKTGSDGMGYGLAQALGHTIVDTTPGLAPLVLEGTRHAGLAGRSHPARLSLRVDGRTAIALSGSLLWTHFGISGPVALDISRHWHRARLNAGLRETVTVAMNLCSGETQQSLEAWLRQQARDRPRARVSTVLATRLPADVADVWTAGAGIAADTTLAHVTRSERRALVNALLDTPLSVRDSRGYNYAEVTAGGVPLEEIDHRTMGSRTCPGLFLVGEMLDVDGRLGGFNFQWAWSSGWVAGQAIAGSVGEREGLA